MSTNSLSTAEAEWLSLVRYQLIAALEQSRQPSPLNIFAINGLQDAVESALALVGEHYNVETTKRADFDKIFDAVTKEPKLQLLSGHRASMLALNNARVAFKHHGNLISDATIRRHTDNAQSFIEELCKAAFDLSLESVSLLLFIPNEKVREFLSTAETAWRAGQHQQAAEALRLAFDLLVRDFEQRKVWYPGNSLFSTKPSFAPSPFDIREYGKTIEKMHEWIENIDSRIRKLALGIDMRRYAYFDAHMPLINYALGGNHFTHWRDGIEVNEEVFGRCYKFVIDTALAFAADDFSFDHFSLRNRAHDKS